MPFEAYSASDSLHNTGGGSSHFPEGQYLWKVSGVQPSKEDGGTGFYFRLSAIEGNPEGLGGALSHFCSVSEKAQWNLGTMCEAVGLATTAVQKLIENVQTYKQHQAVAKVLDAKAKGKTFAATVADESYNGNPVSRLVIASIQSAEGFIKAAAAPRAPAAPKAAAPATPPADLPPPPETDEDLAAAFDKLLAEASA